MAAAVVGLGAWAGTAEAKGGAVGGTGNDFFLNDSFTGTANTVFAYGEPADAVHTGDWDGDKSDTLAIRRGNTFYFRNSNTSGAADRVIAYGDPGDTVLVGDWDGDGTDTLAVRRGNTFYVKNSISSGVADKVFSYGDAGDTVLVGDWNGDKTDTLTVRRGGQYFVKNDLNTGVADRVFFYGDPGDSVLVGHWSTAQTSDTLGVRRGNTYYLRYSLTSGSADKVLGYGDPGDTALVGDWDGDGLDTLGVRRPAGQNWLGELNKYRLASGLSAVTANPGWVAGLQNHFTYLARTPASYLTGPYANRHTENPASPYYTADGALEGGRSNLITGTFGSPVSDIDMWLAAPFHAIGMLRPGLQQVAYASGQGYAGLDVTGGYSYQSHAGPVLFPGPGMTTNLRSFPGENPSPLETCGWPAGLGSSYGLPLIAMLPSNPAAGATASVTGSDGSTRTTAAGSLCLVDEHTYRSSDSVYGPTGASILQGDHAVLLIGRGAYGPGTYTATINQPGTEPIRWTFTVS
ncbi:MAG: hypothetical protein JWP46_4271 [Modestobacter sp.]|nr:hypothetical protein [Modestobacter sp.]